MHCYVINLPTATKRFERTKRELELYCPNLTWSVPKIWVASKMTDSDVSVVYDSKRAWRLHEYELSKGEIACALSHQSALREFLATDDGCCLIIEDDVVFSPAIGRFLVGIEKWLSKYANNPIGIVLSEAYQVRYWASRTLFDEFRLTHPIKSCGAIAYVVNRSGAKLILSANAVPITTTSDHWTFYRKCGLDFMGIDKLLAGSSDFGRGDSSLSKGRQDMHDKMMVRYMAIPLWRRKMRAVYYKARQIWWLLTGVDRTGEKRSNDRLYLKEQRREVVDG